MIGLMKARFPNGYLSIFTAEFGSRFAFWAVQSVIVLYLTKQFLITDSLAYSTAASYEALTYGATFIGGILADRYFGIFRVFFVGILFSILGLCLLAFGSQSLCYYSLGLLVVGMGLYMPTTAAMLDHLYEKDNPARESGYFYLYIATNLGGILGPILFGFISQYGSYSLGFFLCAVLLLAMGATYAVSLKNIQFLRLDPEKIKAQSFTKNSVFIVGLLVLASCCFFLIRESELTKDLLLILFVVAIAWILYQVKRDSAEAKKNVLFILLFCAVSILFFAVEFQILTSIVTFTRDYVDKKVAFINVPTSAFVSLEPLFVVLLAPTINAFFQKFKKNKAASSVCRKFAMSFFCLGLSFLILCGAARHHSNTLHLLNPLWLVASAIFMAAGEVLLMPVLLALVTKDSPEHLKNSLVGFLYLCISFSSYLSGVIANLTKSISAKSAIMGYAQTYSAIFWAMLLISLVLFLSGRFIKRASVNPLN